jgi:retron-type reverse transcriptase
MKDSIWFIEGDIQSYFPSIDPNILMNIIKKKNQEPVVLILIRSGLKAKVFQNETAYTPELGTPQGGILSPLLSNNYLNELDKFMVKLSIEYQGNVKPSNRKKNPLAHKLLREGRKSEYYRLIIPSRIHNDAGYRNCKYIRYADDFIIGIVGPRSLAVEIRGKTQEFIKNHLKLDFKMKKTQITHISKGIKLEVYLFSRKPIFTRQNYSGRVVKRKMTIPTLDVNMEKVISRLAEAKFCNGNGDPILHLDSYAYLSPKLTSK